MADSDEPRGEEQDNQAKIERLSEEVDRLWSRDMAQQLKLSEAKYRALVEGSNDFIYVLDKDGYFTFANTEVEHLLGYQPEEIIGRHFSEILHPEDFQTLGRSFHERRTGERATRRLELRLQSQTGDTRDVEIDIRHFSVSASGIYRDQTYIGTHGVARDITERKYQETKRLALQGIKEVVWSMVRGDDIQLVLNSIRASLETMGIPFSEFGAFVLDMDEPPVLTLYSSRGAKEISKRGEWMVTDTERFANAVVAAWKRGKLSYCRDLDGETTYHERERLSEFFGEVRTIVDAPFSHGVFTVTSSGPAVFTTRDLTFVSELAEVLSEGFHRMEDLREVTLSEKRYRTLVETPNLVVMLLDSRGEFLYVSPQIEQWLGYLPREFYGDRSTVDRIAHPDDLDAIRTFLDSGEAPVLRDLEFRWRAGDGTYHWASGSLFPIFESPEDEQINRVSMTQVVIQDITERKMVEGLIKESLEEKEVLLKEIHHRVKNNLQIISSLLHLQTNDLEDAQVRRIFEDSQHRINSMALIHEELYNSGDLARIDFGDYSRILIENLFDSYGISTSHIALDIQVDAQPLSLDQAIPLGLVINELVSNALKYAFPGGREGHVSIFLQAGPGNQFALTVSDDGIGLPTDIDFQHPNSLGLRLVETLAHQLKANVELDRSTGTTFTIARESS
ncbi:MAG: PAS domain S-box protein [Gemmatimonadetes bacterium]|nr:PAS domain S-box protein [Gemmatimonadota bacterium]